MYKGTHSQFLNLGKSILKTILKTALEDSFADAALRRQRS